MTPADVLIGAVPANLLALAAVLITGVLTQALAVVVLVRYVVAGIEAA